MKKTTIALAALLSSAIAVPAHANDAVKIGVGILGLVINEAAKAGNKGNQRRPGKNDTLIGRVGEQPRGSGRSSNRAAPAAAAGAAAVAAIALPDGEQAPIPTAKPTAVEMSEYAALIASSPSTTEMDIDEGVPLYDEQGRYWGSVTPDEAQKVDQAVALGMKPSAVIPNLLGLKLPEVEGKSMDVPVVASSEPAPEQVAEVPAAPVAPIEEAKAEPVVAPAAETTVTAAAAPAPVAPAQPTTAEATVIPPVDATATTASVQPEPKIDVEAAKPVEPAKPKRKLDL